MFISPMLNDTLLFTMFKQEESVMADKNGIYFNKTPCELYDIMSNCVNHEIKNIGSYGSVKLMDVMPRLVPVGRTGDFVIIQAARTSTNYGMKILTDDEILLRYLKRHKHSTPEEMAELKFYIICPIVVARQLIRHRTANINEFSQRYSESPEKFYVPNVKDVCKQSTMNKQGGSESMDPKIAQEFVDRLEQHHKDCWEKYQWALKQGIARETARLCLPVSIYTEFFFKIDLRNLFHLLELRMDEHAQFETREFANAMYDLIKPLFPQSCRAFEDYQLNSMELTGLEVQAIKNSQSLLSDWPSKTISTRENNEFKEKAKLLGLTLTPKGNHVQDKSFGIISYNVCASFFSDKSEQNKWSLRSERVFSLIRSRNAKVVCIQELSTEQCCDFVKEFQADYDLYFLSQTPSELPLGMIVKNEQVFDWKGRNAGTAIIAYMLNKKRVSLIEINRFWLNEAVDITTLPMDKVYTDRALTDKGFGNFNTYRAVFWVKVIDMDTKEYVFVFNSHYPLSGDNATRFKCAEFERAMISKIAGSYDWFAVGDRNFIVKKEVDKDEEYCIMAKNALNKNAFPFHDAESFFGMKNNTWIGFDYDDFAVWKKGSESILDYCVSSIQPKICYHLHGAYKNKEWLPFYDPIEFGKVQTASDHALVHAVFDLKRKIVDQ